MSATDAKESKGHLCWYCPLFCDRSVVTDPCQLRDRSVQQAQTRTSVSPRIGEASVPWETAIKFASQAISRSRFSCLTGAIGDIVAAGEALDLGRWLNAAIDLFHSDASFACFDVMQRRGAIQTTLNEVRERCDLFLLIGDDGLLERYPLLPERTQPIRNEQRVLLIGDWSESSRKRFESPGRHAIAIGASTDRLASGLLTAEVLSAERKLLASKQLSVVCWSNDLLQNPSSYTVWVEQMHDWIERSNRLQQTASLPLMGTAATFHQVATWRTGFPGRFRCFADGARYDPVRYRAQSLLADDECDLIVWADTEALTQREPPPSEKCQIILSTAPPSKLSNHQVWLPLAIGGWDYLSSAFRADMGTSLPLSFDGDVSRSDRYTIGEIHHLLQACTQVESLR